MIEASTATGERCSDAAVSPVSASAAADRVTTYTVLVSRPRLASTYSAFSDVADDATA
jgi:hypothetical protein